MPSKRRAARSNSSGVTLPAEARTGSRSSTSSKPKNRDGPHFSHSGGAAAPLGQRGKARAQLLAHGGRQAEKIGLKKAGELLALIGARHLGEGLRHLLE